MQKDPKYITVGGGSPFNFNPDVVKEMENFKPTKQYKLPDLRSTHGLNFPKMRLSYEKTGKQQFFRNSQIISSDSPNDTLKSRKTETTFRTKSTLNDYLPANQLLYFDQFNEINQSAYQQDAKSQLKNNNLLKDPTNRSRTILGAAKVSDFNRTRNIKPLISDIYLNTKRNFKKIRLASIDVIECNKSAMKSSFQSRKSSIIKIERKANLNRTMNNFERVEFRENPIVVNSQLMSSNSQMRVDVPSNNSNNRGIIFQKQQGVASVTQESEMHPAEGIIQWKNKPLNIDSIVGQSAKFVEQTQKEQTVTDYLVTNSEHAQLSRDHDLEKIFSRVHIEKGTSPFLSGQMTNESVEVKQQNQIVHIVETDVKKNLENEGSPQEQLPPIMEASNSGPTIAPPMMLDSFSQQDTMLVAHHSPANVTNQSFGSIKNVNSMVSTKLNLLEQPGSSVVSSNLIIQPQQLGPQIIDQQASDNFCLYDLNQIQQNVMNEHLPQKEKPKVINNQKKTVLFQHFDQALQQMKEVKKVLKKREEGVETYRSNMTVGSQASKSEKKQPIPTQIQIQKAQIANKREVVNFKKQNSVSISENIEPQIVDSLLKPKPRKPTKAEIKQRIPIVTKKIFVGSDLEPVYKQYIDCVPLYASVQKFDSKHHTENEKSNSPYVAAWHMSISSGVFEQNPKGSVLEYSDSKSKNITNEEFEMAQKNLSKTYHDQFSLLKSQSPHSKGFVKIDLLKQQIMQGLTHAKNSDYIMSPKIPAGDASNDTNHADRASSRNSPSHNKRQSNTLHESEVDIVGARNIKTSPKNHQAFETLKLRHQKLKDQSNNNSRKELDIQTLRKSMHHTQRDENSFFASFNGKVKAIVTKNTHTEDLEPTSKSELSQMRAIGSGIMNNQVQVLSTFEQILNKDQSTFENKYSIDQPTEVLVEKACQPTEPGFQERILFEEIEEANEEISPRKSQRNQPTPQNCKTPSIFDMLDQEQQPIATERQGQSPRLNSAQKQLHHIMSYIKVADASPRVVTQDLYKVNSKALQTGQLIYKKKNAYRHMKKQSNVQVGEILEKYYKSKANLQYNKFNKWQTKALTLEQDQLNFNTTLENIIFDRDGSPLRGRDVNLVEKLNKEIKPGRGNEQEYSLMKWKGQASSTLATRDPTPIEK